jgi:hypothetical protein
MKTLKSLLFAAILISTASLFSAEKTFTFPTVPGSDNKCRQWRDNCYEVVADGIRISTKKLFYNASVLPIGEAKKARITFKYRGKATRCGLFYYSRNSGLRGRELVYLPNCDKLKEFNGEFDLPTVIDKRRIVGIRLLFQTDTECVISDAAVTLL